MKEPLKGMWEKKIQNKLRILHEKARHLRLEKSDHWEILIEELRIHEDVWFEVGISHAMLNLKRGEIR